MIHIKHEDDLKYEADLKYEDVHIHEDDLKCEVTSNWPTGLERGLPLDYWVLQTRGKGAMKKQKTKNKNEEKMMATNIIASCQLRALLC